MAKKIDTSKIMGNFELPKVKKQNTKTKDPVKEIHQPKPKVQVQKTTIDLPVDLHRELRMRAFDEGTNMKNLILIAVRKYLKED